jgi:hypothetical protein
LAHGVFRSGGGKIEGGDRFRNDLATNTHENAQKQRKKPVNPLFYQNAPSNSRF